MCYLIRVNYRPNKWLDNCVTKVINYMLTQYEVSTIATDNGAISNYQT